MIIKNRDKVIRHNIASVPGGAALGGLTYLFFEALEAQFLEKDGKHIRDVFTGGAVLSSVGSFASPLFLSDPKDPSRPLMTAETLRETFFDRLPGYLPYKDDHYLNHVLHAAGQWLMQNKGHVTDRELDVFLNDIRGRIDNVRNSRIKRSALGFFVPKAAAALQDEGFMDTLHDIFERVSRHDQLPLHLDRSFMEDDLKQLLGEKTTLRDFSSNICITTQKITPGALEPGDFYRTHPGFMRKDAFMPMAEPDIDVPLYKIIMGATAVPTVFDAYHIEETGTTHVDCAHVDNRADNITTLQGNLPKGISLVPVTIGNIRQSAGISAEAYSEMDAISMLMTRFYHNSPGTQSQIRGRRSLRRIFGPDHTHEMEITEKNFPGNTTCLPDMFDSSPEQVARMKVDAAAFLAHNAKAIDQMTDRLLENANGVVQHERGLLGSLGKMMRSITHRSDETGREKGLLEEDKIPSAPEDAANDEGTADAPAAPAAL